MDDRRDMPNNRPQQNINLQPKDILEKDFKQKMRGYDQAEVDEFLDDVIKDYETFNTQLQQLSQENARLISRVDELTKQAAAGGGPGMAPNAGGSNNTAAGSSSSTYDILKRLSNLERRVFGQSQGQSQPREQANTAGSRHNEFNGMGQPNAGAPLNNNTISGRANAAQYQNNVNAADGQPRTNSYQAPANAGMNRGANAGMPQAPANPNNMNVNNMPQNNIPNSNITDARPNNNRNYQNYNNNRFDRNDPDPRYQNNNTNRYNNPNNDLNRF